MLALLEMPDGVGAPVGDDRDLFARGPPVLSRLLDHLRQCGDDGAHYGENLRRKRRKSIVPEAVPWNILPESVTVAAVAETLIENRLRELREDHNPPLELYDLAGHLRVSTDTIRNWERPGSLIPAKYLRPLAELFECSLEHLLGWDRAREKAHA